MKKMLFVMLLLCIEIFPVPVMGAGELELKNGKKLLEQGDSAAAYSYLLQAADKGSVDAMIEIGDMYDEGKGLAVDNGKALIWYMKAADNDDPRGLNYVGHYYYNGISVPRDYEVALRYIRNAAAKGHPSAIVNLGIMNAQGKVLEKNEAAAFGLYKKAAGLGDGRGMLYTGMAYYYGTGVPIDYEEGVKWFIKSAAKDNVEGMYMLGMAYANGKGVKKDDIEALSWHRKAAELGYAQAMYRLGWAYYNGNAVRQSFSQAIDWFKKAALGSDTDAMVRLGIIYSNGEGVSKNNDTAGYWWRKAMNHGNGDASKYLLELDSNTTPLDFLSDAFSRQKITSKYTFAGTSKSESITYKYLYIPESNVIKLWQVTVNEPCPINCSTKEDIYTIPLNDVNYVEVNLKGPLDGPTLSRVVTDRVGWLDIECKTNKVRPSSVLDNIDIKKCITVKTTTIDKEKKISKGSEQLAYVSIEVGKVDGVPVLQYINNALKIIINSREKYLGN